MWMYAFPRRWRLLRSALSVGQSNTAEGQCVRSVALSGMVKHVKRFKKVSRRLSYIEEETRFISLEKSQGE